MSKSTTMTVEVRFGDCDPAGIVFYPRFHRWMDAASLHFFTSCGVPPWYVLEQTTGICGTPILEHTTRFFASATYGEQLLITTHVAQWRSKAFVQKHVITRGAEVVVAIERLSHGHARLRYLKDRDGDLPVGEHVPLLFDRGDGFTIEDAAEIAALDLEQSILGITDAAWRTVKQWRDVVGGRETLVKAALEGLVETGKVECEVGPQGRRATARCFRTTTAPDAREHMGAHGSPSATAATAPTAPTCSKEQSEWEQYADRATAPGAVDPDEVDRLEALGQELGL